MRQPLLLATLCLPMLATPALADCGEDIRAAMVRAVSSGPYRVKTVVTMQGAVSKSVVDIVPGQAMRVSGTSGGVSHETVVIGEQAWMNTDGSWQKMPGEMEAGAVAALEAATGDPDALGEISDETCTGPGGGRAVLAYSYDITSNGTVSHSDVLVDAGTGLPIRTETQTQISGSSSTIVSTYTYDAAITVEAPI